MEFKIKEKEHPNIKNYSPDDYKIAQKFSDAIRKELGEFLKAVILFGSTARTAEKTTIYEPDIDILMIVNDLTVMMTPEVVEAYRVITSRTAADISKRLHITSMKMSAFWEYVRNGDPVAINMLRDGIPLYDVGFFEPAQMLLFQGRIRPTKESIWSYFTRAPATLANSEWHILQATLDLYWAVIDAAHAALMKLGEVPPSPGHIAELIEKKMVKQKLASAKHARTMQFFYDLSKKIVHRQVQKISGAEYDRYKKEAEEFVSAMRKIVEKA